MTVKDLIAELRKMPQGARVGYVWDGAVRSEVRCVWTVRGGEDYEEGPWVALADAEMMVHDDQDRPVDAPLYSEEPYWETPGRARWRGE